MDTNRLLCQKYLIVFIYMEYLGEFNATVVIQEITFGFLGLDYWIQLE